MRLTFELLRFGVNLFNSGEQSRRLMTPEDVLWDKYTMCTLIQLQSEVYLECRSNASVIYFNCCVFSDSVRYPP